ncbi:hypothetical protein AB0P17_29585 [Streptomyces sp. NPDC088124]|uniref:hypothetical protein n=1 Tax=Streptomyces sp. NPDC088124 TaxID=3154654 RepID=UPI00343FB4B3
MQDQRVNLEIGDRGRSEMPYSEVCMDMGIAGQVLEIEVRQHCAQLHKEGQPFSSPITWGEAGIYTDCTTGQPYTYDAEKVPA